MPEPRFWSEEREAGLCGYSSANALGNFIRNFHASAPSPTHTVHSSSVAVQKKWSDG